MKKISFDTIRNFLLGLPENTRILIFTIIYGSFAGSAAVLFMTLINLIYKYTYMVFAAQSLLFFLIASFLLISGTSLIAGFLLFKFEPSAAGSGIPQLKAIYWKEVGFMTLRPVLVKFVGAILNVAGGASLGREGPTVFIGGGIASNLSGFIGVPKRERRSAVVIGASAGLAAAFNAPLAAITFILEEFVSNINNRFIGQVVLSSLIGAFMVFAFVGKQPAFILPSIDSISILHYLITPVVAILAALAGVIFQKSTLFLRGRMKRQKKIPAWLLPFFGGILVWVIGSSVFCTTGRLGVFSLGYEDLSMILENNIIWWVAGIMIVAKLAATVLSYSFGGCGGIFSPLLFIGGMCGYFIGGLAGLWLPVTPADRIVLSAVGMSTCLGSVVRAPLTSLLIVFEMTHQFDFIPGLMIGTFIGVIISNAFGKENFYDESLIQDGHDLIKVSPPLDLSSWHNLPISAISNPKPVVITDLSADYLKDILEKHPYNCYPVLLDGEKKIKLIIREEIQALIDGKEKPDMDNAVTCPPDKTVKEVGNKFIQSPPGVIVLIDKHNKSIVGIVTLHDLLRAQASINE